MSRPNPFPERVNPLAPLGELARWLVGTTIDVALGLAIGMIVARLMRVRHLHWSWAVGALVLVVLLRAPLASFHLRARRRGA